MGSSTKKYLGKVNTGDENRYRSKNYKRLPYANKSMAFDEYEADWLVASKKQPGSTFSDADSDIARYQKASGRKSTISRDRIRASRNEWET